MKHYKYILLCFLSATMLFSSCSLDRSPLDQFAENDFWTSEDNTLLALTGIYKANIAYNSVEYNPTD